MSNATLIAHGERVAQLRKEHRALVDLTTAAERRLADAILDLERAKRETQDVAPRPVELDVRAVRR